MSHAGSLMTMSDLYWRNQKPTSNHTNLWLSDELVIVYKWILWWQEHILLRMSHNSITDEIVVCFLLTGGLQAFQSHYDNLCAKPNMPCKSDIYSPTTPFIEPQIETTTASRITPHLCLGKFILYLTFFYLWDASKNITECEKAFTPQQTPPLPSEDWQIRNVPFDKWQNLVVS